MPTRYWDRILKESLTSLPPPHNPISPKDSSRTDLHQGWVSRAWPPPASSLCPGLLPGSCSLRDLSCAWQGPTSHVAAEGGVRIPPHVRLFDSPSVSLGPKIFRTTLYQPVSTQQTTHPRSNKTLTVQAEPHLSPTLGGPTKHAAPGQLKPPTTQAG